MGDGRYRDLPEDQHKAFRLMDEAHEPCEADGDAFPEADSSAGAAAAYPTAAAVLSVTPEGEGETVAVVLSIPRSQGGKPARVKLHLLVEQYSDLGVRPGEISPEEVDTLLEAGRLCAAVRRGMGLLAYGDQSARRLAYKLTARGVDRATAEAAAAYLAQNDYIREGDTAVFRARDGVRKGWGLRRIREDLRAHGFEPEAVSAATESLSEVDFTENCAAVIRKRYGGVPAERSDRQKLMAAMLRLGYEAEEIRAAMRQVAREE